MKTGQIPLFVGPSGTPIDYHSSWIAWTEDDVLWHRLRSYCTARTSRTPALPTSRTFPRRRKEAGLLIDPEYDNVVGLLVGRKQQPSGGIDLEVARLLASRVNDPCLGERSLSLVDRVDGDAFVAAVGGVQEFARGVNADLGVVIAAGEILGAEW